MKTSKIRQHIYLLFILFFSSIPFLSAQTICLPIAGGSRPGDEPPGCAICSRGIYTGSTGGYTPEQTPIDAPCDIENSQWFHFFSAENQPFEAKIQAYSCNKGKGVEAVLFDKDLIPVSDCFLEKPNNGASLMKVSNIKPFERYHLMIDGIDGDICGIRIEPVRGIHLPELQLSEIIPSGTFPHDLCPGTQRTYTVLGPSTIFYNWDPIPPFANLIAGGSRADNFIVVEYHSTGSGTISVSPVSSCAESIFGDTRSVDVNVSDQPFTKLEIVNLCEEELPITYKGIYIDQFQSYQTMILSEDGCESQLTVQALEKRDFLSKLDTLICPGECVQFKDSCYSVSASMVEGYCKRIGALNITHSDTGYFEVNYFIDTFVNSLVLDWQSIFGAESYQILINGNLLAEQQFTSFLYPISTPGDSAIIQVIPKNKLGCDFYQAEIKTLLPNLTSSVYEEYSEPKITIFPNPNQGRFEIKTDFKIEKVEVFDLNGIQVSAKANSFSNQTEVEILEKESGIHFLKIYSKEGIFVKKVVLQIREF